MAIRILSFFLEHPVFTIVWSFFIDAIDFWAVWATGNACWPAYAGLVTGIFGLFCAAHLALNAYVLTYGLPKFRFWLGIDSLAQDV